MGSEMCIRDSRTYCIADITTATSCTLLQSSRNISRTFDDSDVKRQNVSTDDVLVLLFKAEVLILDLTQQNKLNKQLMDQTGCAAIDHCFG